MNLKRRDFLKITGAVASGFAINGVTGKSILPGFMQDEEAKKIKAFGLQLYTLRDDFPKDPKGILKQVADFGYKQVEGYEGPKGIFWGMSNTELKSYLDSLGITMISTHCDINKDFEKKAAEAAAIGMKYLICPYLGAQKTLDDFKKKADQFNKCGEICKKEGIRFAYHNHDYSFKTQEGQLPQDVMMINTDASIVDFEMDIYWVVTAGHDPIAWFKKYPNRFRLCHVKDRMKNATEGFASCNVGEGSIDFVKILKVAKKQGMQYYIVEQERYDGTTPLKAAEVDAAYMKKIKI